MVTIVCIVYVVVLAVLLMSVTLWSQDPWASTIFVGRYLFERLRSLIETLVPEL